MAKKSKEKVKTKKGILLYSIIMSVIIISLSVYVYRLHLHNLAMDREIAALELDIENAKADSEELKNQAKYRESDEYLEEAARKQLGMVKPNEKIFIEQK